MWDKRIIVGLVFLSAVIPLGKAVKCYHCYEVRNQTVSGVTAFDESKLGDKFVACGKDWKQWNSWDCPSEWPVCVITSATGKNYHEIIRTCGKRDYCLNYVPPTGLVKESCRECTSALCNDLPGFPEPPINPDALFTFNFNINLVVRKYLIPSG